MFLSKNCAEALHQIAELIYQHEGWQDDPFLVELLTIIEQS